MIRVQGPYAFEDMKFKAIQDFLRLFKKEIQDGFQQLLSLIIDIHISYFTTL